jgi:hypothetical protein
MPDDVGLKTEANELSLREVSEVLPDPRQS